MQLTTNFFFRKTKTPNCHDTFREKISVIDEILAILKLFKVEVPLSHDRAVGPLSHDLCPMTDCGIWDEHFRDAIEGIALLCLTKHRGTLWTGFFTLLVRRRVVKHAQIRTNLRYGI